MGWIAAAIAAAGAIGGSAIASSGAKSAASDAANANRQNTADTNAANLNLFNLSRGSPGDDGYGHSILPNYFGGNEQALGQQAYDQFNRLNTAGQNSYNNLLGYQNQLRPSLNASLDAVNNRFNGQDLAQRTAYANPYYNANLQRAGVAGAGLRDTASANSSAINTGLQQTLAQINAQRAGQGFFGSSTFDRNRALQATLGARQQAAVQSAQANAQANNLYQDASLQNAGDLRSLQYGNMDYMSNPAVLGAAQGAASSFESAPANALAQSYTNAMTPLNYFRIAPQSFQQQNMPTVSPSLSDSQILGSALGQAGQAYGNYQFSQQLARNYGYGSGGSGLNPYATGSGAYTGALTQAPSYLNGASAFSNPYASSSPSYGGGFNYQMPTFATGLTPPPGG